MQSHIKFVVGEERRLGDLVTEADLQPLLNSAVKAGALAAWIKDAEDCLRWSSGRAESGAPAWEHPIYLEGELVGIVAVRGGKGSEHYLQGIATLLGDAVNAIVTNNLKRMLTTEIHTTVVNQSYEELLETNGKLQASEAQYRELAEQLEIKVEERTAELQSAHARLLQQEKMASIGQLAAGVAHEINNPLGFIASNLTTLRKYVDRFRAMLDCYRSAVKVGDVREEAFDRKWQELKLDMIWTDADDLIRQSLGGAERVRSIVADLKGFSHIDEAEDGVADFNTEIDRTLSVLSSQIPSDAEIIRNYQPLPGCRCKPAEFCQVFLNIILNALQAKPSGLKLTIATEARDGSIRLCFSDNGPGIPAAIRNRIFDPFYTTKDVGAGTGLGLTVAYEVVTAHGGMIGVSSSPGGGSAFSINIPTGD